MYAYNSYIPQTEQHEPEGQMLFCLGNVINLLDVTPSNPMPHPLHLHPSHFVRSKMWLLSNIQKHTYIQIYFSFPYFPPMSFLTPSHSFSLSPPSLPSPFPLLHPYPSSLFILSLPPPSPHTHTSLHTVSFSQPITKVRV